MSQDKKTTIVTGEISLFDIPFYLKGTFITEGDDKTTKFSVSVGDKTLGEVLNYILDMVGAPRLSLDVPWNVIEDIRLDSFAFEIEISNGQSKYGFSYSDLGIKLPFLEMDVLKVFYRPSSNKPNPKISNESSPEGKANPSVDVEIYGTFLGFDFTKDPISWDAMKEQPPSTPAGSDAVFKLEYLGLGQRVTLRDISQLTTVGKVIDALQDSYKALSGDTADPLSGDNPPNLTYDEASGWLVGARFSVMETFDFSGIWNLPQLAGARIGLRGERAKSLGGFEFEILYRRVAEDLGQYHVELVLPDVLRRFQAGIASVTLPIIAVDIYTDGGFKIDLGFPTNLDFSRSFTIELVVLGIPVTGSIGVYFGVLSEKAVPELPAITGGSFKPVIIAGAGFRIGVGKSFSAGILDASIFIGIEGLLEGVLAFYEPFEDSEPNGTFYKVSGHLQLIGHIQGSVDFVIIKAAVEVTAYVSAYVDFEAYRMTMVVFEAGVKLELSVKVGFGIFSFTVDLSFNASIKTEIPLGEDTQTPWVLDQNVGSKLTERIGPVAYRRLPNGDIIADETFMQLLSRETEFAPRLITKKAADGDFNLELFFHPVTTIGVSGDHPDLGITDVETGTVNLVANLMARLSRNTDEPLSPAETFAYAALQWGLAEIKHYKKLVGSNVDAKKVMLSDLRFLADDLTSPNPLLVIDMEAMEKFLSEFVTLSIVSSKDLEDKGTKITPFPMIPFFTLQTGTGETKGPYATNFETEPMCSAAYQENIAKYFEALNSQPEPKKQPNARKIQPIVEELSMSGLIFVDSFKLVLRSIVSAAIDELAVLNELANGDTLKAVATRTGLDSEAAFKRLVLANVENKYLFAIDSPLVLVAQSEQLTARMDLNNLAHRFKMAKFPTAKHLRTQPILAATKTIIIKGGKHLIAANDTKDSIRAQYGIGRWPDVEDANPIFDWSAYPSLPNTKPPTPPWPPEYPVLHLPAGEWIKLPDVKYKLLEGDTLQSLCDKFNTELFNLIETEIPFVDQELAYKCVTLYIDEGETVKMLADRAGLSDVSSLTPTLESDSRIIPEGAKISVPAGQHIIARDDTLVSLALKFQTTPEAIKEANSASPWKFVPRWGTSHSLPMGVTIDLPPVPEFIMGRRQTTFKSVATLFGVTPYDVIEPNEAILELTTLAAVIMPPLVRKVAHEPDKRISPLDWARPYALSPVAIIKANQGAEFGQGKDVKLDTVIVPDCEIIDESQLTGLLSDGEMNSPFAKAVTSMARFLLVGLRLPAPGGAAELGVPPVDEPLYPLYTLTGQQWPAPENASEQNWVELTWNKSARAKKLIAACVGYLEPPKPIKVNFTAADIQLINEFGTALGNLPEIQPNLLAVSGYPALEQVPLEHALGAPTNWAMPGPITFKGDIAPEVADPGESSRDIYLHDVPDGLRKILPRPGDPARNLFIEETEADSLINKKTRRVLTDVGWATRLDVQINEIGVPGTENATLPFVYEALSCKAQTQADLEGLRQYILGEGKGLPIDLYLLFPAGALSSVAGSLRSDIVSPGAKKDIVLLKTNLSTFSNPGVFLKASETIFGDEGKLASATFENPVEFLELLWQLSVTNAGGFYLDYGVPEDGPGLPDSVFKESDTATISILAVVRQSATAHTTISPRRFHNIIINAENLTSRQSSLLVSADRHAVVETPAVPPDPATTQSLAEIALLYGLSVEDLAVLNATTPNCINVGSVISMPDGESAPQTYTVEAGDDLLTIALALELEVGPLSIILKDRKDLLHAGAKLEVYPEWVVSTNKVSPNNGGFRVVRSQPIAPPVPVGPPIGLDAIEAKYRIENYFNLMGYGLAETADFNASSLGLPIPPCDPDEDQRNGLYALPEGALQPWTYQRQLPIAAWASTTGFLLDGTTDPYAGLGFAAKIEFDFQDIFGNKLPRSTEPLSVDWKQLYRDPLIPVHTWPSVTLSFDVERQPSKARQMTTKIKFSPAGYTGSIGVSRERLAERARADGLKFAEIYYQVVDHRIEANIITSLQDGKLEGVDSEDLTRLSKEAFEYLRTVEQLEPIRHKLIDSDRLSNLARAYGLTLQDLGQHLANDRQLLAPGKKIIVPQSITVLPNTSIEQILKRISGLKPSDIGNMNPAVALTPGLEIKVGTRFVVTQAGDTLEKLVTGKIKPAQIATANVRVSGLFLGGETLKLGSKEQAIRKGNTLASIAKNEDEPLRLELLISANDRTDILKPGTTIEIPLHSSTAKLGSSSRTAKVGKNQSLKDLTNMHKGYIRDICSANSDIVDLLRIGEKILYPASVQPSQNMDATRAIPDIEETIRENDTLATLARRVGTRIGDPSVVPADIGGYARNAKNPDLLQFDAVALLPPSRIIVDMSILSNLMPKNPIFELSAHLKLERKPATLIDPAFANSQQVKKAYSRIPPRLASNFSRDQRSTPVAFAKNFQEVFGYLKLATGPDRQVSSLQPILPSNPKAPETRFVVVNWSSSGLGVTVEHEACFFAPKPLLTKLWAEEGVHIFPYIPGQPLYPDPDAFVATNYAGADIERWAETLLRRIDRLLLPDMAAALRKLSQSNFKLLVGAKRKIADAVANRTDLILEPNAGVKPDKASARKQLLQQLLVELSSTYRGGTVVQYNVKASAPDGLWSPDTSPRMLCSWAPEMTQVSTNLQDATLDKLAAQFGTKVKALLIAYAIQDILDILAVGKVVPVGSKPIIKKTDTIRSILNRASTKAKPVTMGALVAAVRGKPNFLKPGAGIPLVTRTYKTRADDTFGSVLEHLAPDLVSQGRINDAISVLDNLNGKDKGVFLEGIKLSPEVTTFKSDSINSVAKALKMSVTDFINKYYVKSPLLAPDADYMYLALYPPSTLSASKLSFFKSSEETPNKLNTVYVTTTPDEASSVTLKLGYQVQALEYNIHENPNMGGYQASQWLTFIDWKFGEDLEKVVIPIPNRQFPLPPTVTSHDVIPQVKDGNVKPDELDKAAQFDYVMQFAFDAATQDELYYEPSFNVGPATVISAALTEKTKLAHLLAQYQAIDVDIWLDLFKLTKFSSGESDDTDVENVKNAVNIFADLADQIGDAWASWDPEISLPITNDHYRIQCHSHPDGRANVTMAPVLPNKCAQADTKVPPSARLIGHNNTTQLFAGVQHTELGEGHPIPRTKRGEHYEVNDPNLTILSKQNCWGKISVTRNKHLVQGATTTDPFILNIRDVRALNPVIPRITITQKLTVANELGRLETRLTKFIAQVLFPEIQDPRPSQSASFTAAFARPVVDPKLLKEELIPADITTMFAPVVTTPMLHMQSTGSETFTSPEEISKELSAYLTDYLKQRSLAPLDEWALTLKIFSNIDGQEQPALLFELLDLRTRMSES